jgi:homoserine kinase
MQKIKIRLPATVVNFGPGLNSLGLALSLYTTIEVSPRSDESLIVEPHGEGAGHYPVGLRHPVVLALMRVFQRLERAPLGIHIRVDNTIPLASGLGAETAFLLAGVIGANNLMHNPYRRDRVLQIAAQISRPDSAVTAMLGGLTASILEDDALNYRTLPVQQLKIVVVLPQFERYVRPGPVERVPMTGAVYNISRVPLLIDAMRQGDLPLIAASINDYIQTPRIIPQITGYNHVVERAKEAGAVTVTVAGDGPALMAFAEDEHEDIAAAMRAAFGDAGVEARSWVLPIDTQGVVISVLQSSG